MIEDIRKEALKDKVPIIKDDGLAFILELIRENGYRNILELGTAVGYSAMSMAMLDERIHVDTVEKDPVMYRQAMENIKDNGLEGQIDVYNMAAEEFGTDKKYDLIFVDAAKAQYGKYMERFIGNLEDNGKMIFDNMIFHGLVLSDEEIPSRSLRALVRKIRAFRESVQNDERFDIMMCDNIGDGILVLGRRKDEA